MTWSISEVAKASGTTSRTLRHYDDIGLLRPVRTGQNGYRFYGQAEMLRLQHILLYREFGVPLDQIREILDGEMEPAVALLAHKRRLRSEIERLRRIERTVERTLDTIKEQRIMALKDIFEGFDPVQQSEYEKEIVDRYGEEGETQIAEGYRRMESWTKDDAERQMKRWHVALTTVGTLMTEGANVEEDRVQDAITGHFAFVSAFWTPDHDAYLGLGEMYVSDERFRTQLEDVAPGLAEFFRNAMAVYAERNLA